jgi:hypothetical protein
METIDGGNKAFRASAATIFVIEFAETKRR